MNFNQLQEQIKSTCRTPQDVSKVMQKMDIEILKSIQSEFQFKNTRQLPGDQQSLLMNIDMEVMLRG